MTLKVLPSASKKSAPSWRRWLTKMTDSSGRSRSSGARLCHPISPTLPAPVRPAAWGIPDGNRPVKLWRRAPRSAP